MAEEKQLKHRINTTFQLNSLIERASPTALSISEFLMEFRNSVSYDVSNKKLQFFKLKFFIENQYKNALLLLLAVTALLCPIAYLEGSIVNQTIEVGEAIPAAEDFRVKSTAGGEKAATFSIAYAETPQVDTAVPGAYSVRLTCMGITFTRTVFVRDTVAPTAVTRDITLTDRRELTPEDFLESVTDATAVTAVFSIAPDYEAVTDQVVQVLLTDEGGNTATVNAWLTLDLDRTSPTLTGVKNIAVYAGDTVSYRANVTVTDDRDESPTLTVDTENVDLSTPGEYTATYIAADESGNETRQSITVTVLEMQEGYATQETINALVEEILGEIITDDMTTIQQVRAVYDYVRDGTGYGEYDHPSNYLQAGYLMLTRRSGDCYNYFSAGKLLLDALGIPNIDVVKVENYEGDSEHYWSLVSVDGGKTYYHLDMTPRRSYIEVFLLTDAELDAYSRNHSNCYNRDTSLYPATPEEGPE